MIQKEPMTLVKEPVYINHTGNLGQVTTKWKHL